MDLMKNIDAMAKNYVPEEVVEEGMYDMMKSAMTPPADVKPSDKLDLAKKRKRKKHLKDYMKHTKMAHPTTG